MHVKERLVQRTTNTFVRVVGIKEPTLITGKGCLNKIPEYIKAANQKTVLLITIKEFMEMGTLNDLLNIFTKNRIRVIIYTDVTPNPTIACVENALKLYNDEACEAIIAIGGGSVLDCAKIVGARYARKDKTIPEMRGLFKINKKLPDIYAVPTTAGTGSETTIAAVITDEIAGQHYKYAINDPSLVPKYAVLSPEITASMPSHITASTGMDALTHAIEAYTNLYATEKVNENATKAVKLIFENLEKAYKDGNDLDARENMLFASFYAGLAFTNNYVGYVHALAHAIGAIYNLPHGLVNAILLPRVMENFGSNVYKPLSTLADLVGIDGINEEEKARSFIDEIDNMNKRMNIPSHIKELQKQDFDEIIKRAIKEGNPSYPVPEIWDWEDFRKVLFTVYISKKESDKSDNN